MTRFYLSDGPGAPLVTPAIDAWDDNVAGAIRARLLPVRSGGGEGTQTIQTELDSAERRFLRQYVSDPLTSQTVDGTFKGQVRCATELNARHDRVLLSLRVFSEDGLTLRGTLLPLGHYGATNTYSDFPTFTNRKIADGDALSPIVTLAGDRIVCEVGTMASTTEGADQLAVSFKFTDTVPDLPEDETTTSPGAAWVEFSKTLEFVDAPPPEMALPVRGRQPYTEERITYFRDWAGLEEIR